MMSWLVVRRGARRVRADDPRGAGARRRRRARRRLAPTMPRRAADVPRRGDRLRRVRPARRHPAEGGRDPVHDRREERRRRRHLVREHATRAAGSTSATTSTATRSSRATTGPSSSPSSPSSRRYFERVMDDYGVDAPRPVRDRGGRRRAGTTTAGTWRVRDPRRRRAPRRRSPPRAVISAVGQLNRPKLPDIAGHRRLRGPVVPLGPVGPRRRPRRPAGRGDRRRRERLPDRADHRRRGRAPHRVPAHRAVDVPEPELPRAGRARRPLGAAPPAVLRALVPLPALLARLRRRARRRARRPRLPGTRTGRQRDQRRSPARSSRSGSRARSATTPTCVAKVVPDYPATGKRTLQDNGSWLRALTRDDVDLVRTGIDADRARRRRHRRRRARHEADVIVYATGFHANQLPVADGDRRPRRRRARASSGATPDGLPRHHGARTSRTCSACTARAPTWPTAAA